MSPVRRATVEDAEAIAKVQVDAWRVAYRGRVPDALIDRLDVGQRAAVWQRVAVSPRQSLFVAEEDALGVVGFCNLMPSRDAQASPQTAEIAGCYVAPGRWRRGHGRALLRAAVEQARSERYTTLTLWVLEDNPRARAFYEAEGYRHDGAHQDDDRGDGAVLHEVRYRLTLA